MNPLHSPGKLRTAAIASLYFCSLLFVLPSVLKNLDRPGARSSKGLIAQGAGRFAIADLDGDSQPDLATIRVARDTSQSAEYFLELQLSSGSTPSIGILGPSGGLQITSQDVNGDRIADLVITSPFDTQFVAIFLNDGKGNFRRAASSDYPHAGEGPKSRFLSHDDSGQLQPNVEQKRGMEGQEFAQAGWEHIQGDDSQLFRPDGATPRSARVLVRRGRAPPRA